MASIFKRSRMSKYIRGRVLFGMFDFRTPIISITYHTGLVYLPIGWVSKKGKEEKRKGKMGKGKDFIVYSICALKIILRSYSVAP